ncbi:hypothetical protein QBC34DRAFT_486781 [Podospora aff. communis PSN243]|uniref:Uncharacterized protein n=1 Tax=Podospora aff. communis PSN243 TaxID=3040156 RepID=A0AAV9GFY8_9PEZI|nr:hypothetical protein QBC34DRAFT_486781 [Podospora aff. communis PSN243]
MGKKKETLAFIPGFIPLAPSIWIQDAASLANSTNNPHTTNTPYAQSSPSSSQQHQPTRRPALTFSASSSPLPLPSTSEATSHGTPDLILITSWTGALPKHIAKYTLSYNQLYPGVPIMVITTTIWDLALHSLDTKIKTVAPAAEHLLHSKRERILLHAFSEGGAHKAVCLARAYLLTSAKSGGGPGKLPIRAFIFDSTPGTPRYTSNVAAFKRSLPRNPAARALGLPIGASVLGVTWVLFIVFVGYENNVISETRRALNDEKLWVDVRGAPRTYLFSERDDLINWRDVERHGVESAEKLGVRSLLVRFRMSGHCGHARGNEGVYWGAVRRTWEAWDAGKSEGPGFRQLRRTRRAGERC